MLSFDDNSGYATVGNLPGHLHIFSELISFFYKCCCSFLLSLF